MAPRKQHRSSFALPALLWAVVVVATALGTGCNRSQDVLKTSPTTDHNVLLITIDTLRADHVGAYGGSAKTPTLDGLAAEGMLFTRCISQTPLTLPSHTSILSGTYPPYHGVRDNGGFVVPGELELISETLRRSGYATAAFVGAYVLHSKWGLSQGFDIYSDTFERKRYHQLLLQNSKRADEVLGAAREWIGTTRDQKFFAWIHLFDPHTPYRPPPPSTPTRRTFTAARWSTPITNSARSWISWPRPIFSTEP